MSVDLTGLQLTERDGACLVPVRAQPRASRTAIQGVHAGALKVQLQAPPVDGAANDALVAWLAREVLGLPPRDVRLIRGEASRDKLLAVSGRTAPEVLAALTAYAR